MPNDVIDFTISIPVRESDADIIINAFLSAKPYNRPYLNQVEDLAGNLIDNPITPAMYVEDCIAFYILEITKNYLLAEAQALAVGTATSEANQIIDNLRSWIDSL